MKNTIRVFGVIVLLAIIGVTMAGCATTTIGGASLSPFNGSHGLFSIFTVDSAVTDGGAKKVESYMVILGLFDIGFDKYATEVVKVEKANRKIVTVEKNFFNVVTIVTAYVE